MKNMYIKLIIALIPSISLYVLGVKILDNPVQILGFLAYFYFFITLSLSPLGYILRKIQALKKYSSWLIVLRRQFGICTAIFALAHIMKVYEKIWELYNKFFITQQSLLEFILNELSGLWGNIFWMNIIAFWLWTLWIFILSLLLISSNNYSQKFLWGKSWKKLQQLSYPLFIIIVLHIYFIGGWKWVYLYPALILIVLRMMVFLDKKRFFL